MKIIGRKTETADLIRCEKATKSELVCVYGRRRVGKTFLVEQTFAGQFAFRATGVEGGNTRQQLRSFHQRLKEHGDTNRAVPKDWFEAFSRLDTILTKGNTVVSPHNKKIVFLDEFPWFATSRSDFLMAFGEFWNRRGTESGNYLFIICGSATSWIIKNILENTGSLYHRVTSLIYLKPFTLNETEKFFIDREFGWSRKQITECQMIFGGLPYFLDLLDHNESLRQNIDRLIFRPNALLRDESNRLLEATLKKSPVYKQILELLAHKRYGMLLSQCKEELGIADGTYSRAIEDLVKCGYIIEYKRKYDKSNPNFIQLADPFLLFHYHFLSGNNNIDSYNKIVENEGVYTNWRGHAFELLCIHHRDQLKEALGISGVNTKIFPWTGGTPDSSAQIDLVIERADHITDICEMKYTDKPFAISRDYEIRLLNKRDVFKEVTGTDQALKIVMVSAEGISGVAHTENIAAVITIDDLFEV